MQKNETPADLKEVLFEISKLINPTNYYRIKDIFEKDYGLPELMFVKIQICRCITMGFNLAAFTLTNHLLEKSLKFLLIYHDSSKQQTKEGKDFEFFDPIKDSTEKYDDKNLRPNIDRAFKENLIDETQRDRLHYMREKYRNALSHSDRKKLYGESSIEISEVKGFENVEKMIKEGPDSFPKKEFELFNVPLADFLFVKDLTDKYCVDYFLELDGIITSIIIKIFPKGSLATQSTKKS